MDKFTHDVIRSFECELFQCYYNSKISYFIKYSDQVENFIFFNFVVKVHKLSELRKSKFVSKAKKPKCLSSTKIVQLEKRQKDSLIL